MRSQTGNPDSGFFAPWARLFALLSLGFMVEACNVFGDAGLFSSAVHFEILGGEENCEPLAVTCPPGVVAECEAGGTAVVDPGDALAVDRCSAVTVTDPGPGTYPLGTTAVVYTATNASENNERCVGTVTVRDTTPPVIVVTAKPTLWPPNHGYQRISLADCGVKVMDGCQGEIPPERGEIFDVDSDEPDDEAGDGDGDTVNDSMQVSHHEVDLRAERADSGDGRVYTISFEVKDDAGNVATGVCTVSVPRDGR